MKTIATSCVFLGAFFLSLPVFAAVSSHSSSTDMMDVLPVEFAAVSTTGIQDCLAYYDSFQLKRKPKHSGTWQCQTAEVPMGFQCLNSNLLGSTPFKLEPEKDPSGLTNQSLWADQAGYKGACNVVTDRRLRIRCVGSVFGTSPDGTTFTCGPAP